MLQPKAPTQPQISTQQPQSSQSVSLLSLCHLNSNREPRPTDQKGGGGGACLTRFNHHTQRSLFGCINWARTRVHPVPSCGKSLQAAGARCELRRECGLRWRDGRGGNGGEEALGWGKQRTPLRMAVQRFRATVPWCSAARPPVGCMEDSNFSVPGPGGKPLGLARPVPARAPALYSTQMPKLCF